MKEFISDITSRNYIHHMSFYFYTICLHRPTKIKPEIHVCLKSIVRGPVNNIFLSIDKELGKAKSHYCTIFQWKYSQEVL